MTALIYLSQRRKAAKFLMHPMSFAASRLGETNFLSVRI